MKLLLRLVVEGRVASQSDRRMLEDTRWDIKPLPLWGQMVNKGHEDAPLLGNMVALRRIGSEVYAVAESSDDYVAKRAKTFIEDGSLNGVSVDLGEVQVVVTDKIDGVLTERGETLSASPIIYDFKEPSIFDDSVEPIMIFRNSYIAGATLVGMPAFSGSYVKIMDDSMSVDEIFATVEEQPIQTNSLDNVFRIVASTGDNGGRVEKLDKKFFQKMSFSSFTRMMITEEGHIFGHVYRFGDQHRTVPYTFTRLGQSTLDADFMQGSAIVTDGEIDSVIPVANITYLSPHAPDHTSNMSSAELFEFVQEHTGAKMAAVVAWEDEFGLAVSGQLFSDVKPVDASKALAGGWSVDIRLNNNTGRYAVFGVHCVNQMGAVAGCVAPEVVEYDDGAMVRLVASIGDENMPDGNAVDFGVLLDGLVDGLGRSVAVYNFQQLDK